MNIRYSVRKADGRDYKNDDELQTDIRKNAHGWWLPGISRYWHGGIHVGSSSSQDLADEDNYLQIITTDYKAHIELLSLDEHVPDLVANMKGIKTGKKLLS